MKIHLRFDRHDSQHAHLTLFINGQNNGTLCTSPAEAIWLNHVLREGVAKLSLPDDKPPVGLHYFASGHAPDPSPEAMDECVRPKSAGGGR